VLNTCRVAWSDPPRVRFFVSLVWVGLFAYADLMYATVVGEGRVVRFKLSPALARALRKNRGKTVTEQEAVAFVEAKRHARTLRHGRPGSDGRS